MPHKTSILVLSLAFCGLYLGTARTALADDLPARALEAARAKGGAGEPVEHRSGKLAAGSGEHLLLKLAPAQCVVAAAASDHASDLELSVKTRDGAALADQESGPVAHVRYCAGAVAEKAQVRVRSDAAASYAVGIWNVGGSEVAAPAAAAADEAQTPVSLAQRLAVLASAHAAGLQAMTPPREEDLGTGDARERDVPLDAGRCYRVLAVGDASLSKVTLALRDGTGKPLLTPAASGTSAVLAQDAPFCPTEAARFKLAVSVEGGAGRVLWQVFGAASATHRWPVGGDSDALPAKRLRTSHQRLADGKSPAMAYLDGRLNTADSAEAGFEVQPGFCYVAVAAGTPSLRSLDLELIDQRGNLIAQARDQGSLASARACSALKARWTVRARAFKGYGEYGVQVFGGPAR